MSTKTVRTATQAGDTAMISKHAIVLAIILGTAAGALVTKQQHTDTPTFPEQSSVGSSASTPIIVAQGRCYNGTCY
jgi:hypothetical protein